MKPKSDATKQMVRCPVCGAMSYPLVNKDQVKNMKDGEVFTLMCGACHRIMNPFFDLIKEYSEKFEELKKIKPIDIAPDSYEEPVITGLPETEEQPNV